MPETILGIIILLVISYHVLKKTLPEHLEMMNKSYKIVSICILLITLFVLYPILMFVITLLIIGILILAFAKHIVIRSMNKEIGITPEEYNSRIDYSKIFEMKIF